ncbi:hypothetical protein Q2S68_002133 [Escherichia coli]|nr:hypothetical protein [Escherichia coli]
MAMHNIPMTAEQLEELMSAAVQMQCDSEKAGEREVSIFAYAVQVAVSEIRKVREELTAAHSTIEKAREVTNCPDGVDLQDHLRALVAESLAIKAMNDCLAEELRGYESDGAFDGPNMHLLWWKCETQATDSILHEAEARGVEKLASLAGNECQRYKSVNDRAGVRKWKSIVILCSDFATQLRKEDES